MKLTIAILSVLLLALQYRLWVGNGSMAELVRLDQDIEKQEILNERDRLRNRQLEVEIVHLQSGPNAIEEFAREDMGMIKQGETFYLVVDSQTQKSQ
jgi:cell division protein FtsB